MMDAVRLDKEGNIDTKSLEKELKDALEFDVNYKQRDNMKKRASKAAASYDEFRSMVDCAHLKKLSSAEVRSLGEKKKGWSKTPGADISKDALILQDELRRAEQRVGFGAGVGGLGGGLGVGLSPSDFKPPRTTAELGRDLRRVKSMEEKVAYMCCLGLKRGKALLKRDLDADLLDELLSIFVSDLAMDKWTEVQAAKVEKSKDVAEAEAGVGAEVEVEGGECIPAALKPLNPYRWIKALTTSGRFSLTIALAAAANKDKVKLFLAGCGDEGAEEISSKF
jgi:hypothetical protein